MSRAKYTLKCINCSREYQPDDVLYTCPECGNRRGTLEVVYHFSKETRWLKEEKKGIAKFCDLLPIDEALLPSNVIVGDTPLYKSENLAKAYSVKEILIKDDGKNPTASFKDRASIIAVAKAKELGYSDIYAASTGNAASSLSGISAGTSVSTHIFVPQSAPEAKIAQMLIYGAQVFAVQGTYDQAFDLSLKTGEKNGWYCRNSAVNPYLLEGKKTCALEIAHQTKLQLPDWIFVSVGDGTVYSSFLKGFSDLKELGIIDNIPKVIGVQACGCDPVLQTFRKGEPFIIDDLDNPQTDADSISVGKPRDYLKACLYAQKHNGDFISVTDQQIGEAIMELARKTGVFAEPAAAASFAGFKKMAESNLFGSQDTIALIITGNGLKDIKTPQKYLREKVNSIHPDDELVFY